MTHFQTVNDILIRDRIRILTTQIQNMLETAFNRHRKPMSRSVLLRRKLYTWPNIFQSKRAEQWEPELVVRLIQVSINGYDNIALYEAE